MPEPEADRLDEIQRSDDFAGAEQAIYESSGQLAITPSESELETVRNLLVACMVRLKPNDPSRLRGQAYLFGVSQQPGATLERLHDEMASQVAGALMSCIDAHGPITKALVSSATKRIIKQFWPVALLKL